MQRRVVVTGIGCVSPVGNDPLTAWKAVRNGDSGVARISRFDATNYPTQIAAEVRHFDLSRWMADVATYSKCGANVRYGLAASIQAVEDSGLDLNHLPDPSRFGVYLGGGEGAQDFNLFMGLVAQSADAQGNINLQRFTEAGMHQLDAGFEAAQEPGVLASHVAGLFGAEGPNLNTLTACAASAQAIGEGSELIRRGAADIMIVGGAHSMIHPFGVTGFCLLTTLSKRNDAPEIASRPFDRERDGFVLGEGAAMLVIEDYEHARQRKARIYGEIRGYGVAADAYRITDIPPDGSGVARAMRLSLRHAGLNANEIQYVNAHGTSTSANDRTETVALKSVFGEHAYGIPVSSTKSTTGHLVAACGGLEAIFCLLALNDKTIPPTSNYEYPDPACDLDYVPNTARETPLKHVMSNNSGFGGQNVSLIFSQL